MVGRTATWPSGVECRWGGSGLLKKQTCARERSKPACSLHRVRDCHLACDRALLRALASPAHSEQQFLAMMLSTTARPALPARPARSNMALSVVSRSVAPVRLAAVSIGINAPKRASKVIGDQPGGGTTLASGGRPLGQQQPCPLSAEHPLTSCRSLQSAGRGLVALGECCLSQRHPAASAASAACAVAGAQGGQSGVREDQPHPLGTDGRPWPCTPQCLL